MDNATRAWAYLALIVPLVGGCAVDEFAFDPAAGRAIMAFPDIFEPLAARSKPSVPPREPEIIMHGERATLIYTCNHAGVEELRATIEAFTSVEAAVQTCPSRNALVISDTRPAVEHLLRLLKALDRPTPQLLVEARVVEMTLDKDFEFEVQHIFKTLTEAATGVVREAELTLETPGSSPSPALGARIKLRPWKMDTRQFDMFLRLLVTRGKARILSSPNLTVSHGESADIITGEELPVQSATVVSGSVSTTTQFKRVGIKLQVTPRRITDDSAKIEINTEVSTVTGFTEAGSSGVSNPIVSVRSVHTTLTVKDGEVITIGGLLRSEDREVVRKVPGLGDIPGLGILFRGERKESIQTQLVFFLRVHILPEGRVNAVRLHRPGSSFPATGADKPEPSPATMPAREAS